MPLRCLGLEHSTATWQRYMLKSYGQKETLFHALIINESSLTVALIRNTNETTIAALFCILLIWIMTTQALNIPRLNSPLKSLLLSITQKKFLHIYCGLKTATNQPCLNRRLILKKVRIPITIRAAIRNDYLLWEEIIDAKLGLGLYASLGPIYRYFDHFRFWVDRK